MFQTPTATAVPPRPAYPDAARIVVDADRRTREMAEAMLRLNAEHPHGCTEVTLMLEGFSPYEQAKLGDMARSFANTGFVRQVDEQFARKTDEELLAIALDRVGGLIDAGQIVASLRGDLSFTHDSIARIWPKLMVKLATKLAKVPVPAAQVA